MLRRVASRSRQRTVPSALSSAFAALASLKLGGQWQLRQSKRDAKKEAARLFTLAASDCPPSFNEASAARAELKALGTVR